MNTTIDTVEELINTLNPNVLQCYKCKKWFLKDKVNYNCIKLYNVCTECFHRNY